MLFALTRRLVARPAKTRRAKTRRAKTRFRPVFESLERREVLTAHPLATVAALDSGAIDDSQQTVQIDDAVSSRVQAKLHAAMRIAGRAGVNLPGVLAKAAPKQGQNQGQQQAAAKNAQPLSEEDYAYLVGKSGADDKTNAILNNYNEAKKNLEQAQQKLTDAQSKVDEDPIVKDLKAKIEAKQKELDKLNEQVEQLERQIEQLETDARQPTPQSRVIKLRKGHYVILDAGQPPKFIDLRKQLKELPAARDKAAKELEQLQEQLENRKRELVKPCQDALAGAQQAFNDAVKAAEQHIKKCKKMDAQQPANPGGKPDKPGKPSAENAGVDTGPFTPQWLSAAGGVFGQLISHIRGVRDGKATHDLEKFILQELGEGGWATLTSYLGTAVGSGTKVFSGDVGLTDILKWAISVFNFVNDRGEQLGAAFNGHLQHKRSKPVLVRGYGEVGTLHVCIEIKNGQYTMTVELQMNEKHDGKVEANVGGKAVTLRSHTVTYTGTVVAPK